MERLININQDTIDELDNYLSLPKPPGLILQGVPGLGKEQAAKYAAGRLLNCSPGDLPLSPDYYETAAADPLKVEDMELLIEKSRRCSIGGRKLFLVNQAHSITRRAQNRLLKLLEDRAETNILILISEENRLLDTIKSRCYMISFHPLNEKDMKQYLTGCNIRNEYLDFTCYLTENAPFSFSSRKKEVEDYISCYQQICKITMREDLLFILHTIKEKSDSDFYTIHADNPKWNIRLLLYPFYKYTLNRCAGCREKNHFPDAFYSRKQAMKILLHGMEHLSMAQMSYTKNDYFNLIRFIIEVNG